MRWKTICFDLDNTLFSHEDAFEKSICFCFKSILAKKKIDKDIEIKQLFTVFKKYSDVFWSDYENGVLSPLQYRRNRFLETAAQFQLPFNFQDADEFHEHYYDIVDNFSEPFPKLDDLMKTIVGAGVKVGIITNGTTDTQYSKIKKLNLDKWISNDSIFVSEELKVSKPDRKIFDLAKEKLHSEGSYLYVGDSWEHDVVGSIEAEWDSIFLNSRNESATTAHEPFAICNSLEDVANVIFKENRLRG